MPKVEFDPNFDPMPTVRLSNNVIVANFSSPHSFTFTDGSVLPPCSEQRARALMLEARELEFEGIRGTKDVALSFHLNDIVREAMHQAESRQDVHIVIVPLPVLQALEQWGWTMEISKARVIRMADRVNKIACHDKFCRSQKSY